MGWYRTQEESATGESCNTYRSENLTYLFGSYNIREKNMSGFSLFLVEYFRKLKDKYFDPNFYCMWFYCYFT